MMMVNRKRRMPFIGLYNKHPPNRRREIRQCSTDSQRKIKDAYSWVGFSTGSLDTTTICLSLDSIFKMRRKC